MKKAMRMVLVLALCLSLFASIAPAALADDAGTTYTVTVNLGENTMLAEKSGALVQTVAAGSAIEDIHITTPEETPCFFPEDYASIGEYNGITVALVAKDKQSAPYPVISGTPTQDTQIDLADAEKFIILHLDIEWGAYATGSISYSYENRFGVTEDEVSHEEVLEYGYFNNSTTYERMSSMTLKMTAVPGEDCFLDEEQTIDGTGTYETGAAFVEALMSDEGATLQVGNDDETTIAIVFSSHNVPEPEPEPEPDNAIKPYIPYLTPQPTAPAKPTTPANPDTPPADPKPEPDPEPYKPFNDVNPSDYFADAVKWALENNVAAGTTLNTFSPSDPTSRAQMITFLWRAVGSPEPNTQDNPFEDVQAGDYFYKAVLWAVENGVAFGVDETHFDPDAPVTRAQAAAFLYRYIRSEGKGFTGMWAFPLTFSDALDVPEYAYEPFCWLTMKEILSGTPEGQLLPLAPCTRAQIVTMLYRYFGK